MALPVRRTSGVTPETQPRWEPFRDLEQLHADMDRLMQTVWSPAQGGGTDGIWVPVADIVLAQVPAPASDRVPVPAANAARDADSDADSGDCGDPARA